MRMQTGQLAATEKIPAPAARVQNRDVQRKCACGGECAACRQKRLGLQRHVTRDGREGLNPDSLVSPSVIREGWQSPGHALASGTRAFMETRFGYDFSRVRVHTDRSAERAALALRADAFTRGEDIYFGARQYAPHTASGRRLLAHELTHILQQGDASQPHDLQVNLDASHEQEADRAAEAVEAGSRVPAHTPVIGAPGLQRKVTVHNPTGVPAGAPATGTNEKIIKDYVSTLCSGFTVTSGDMTPSTAAFCASAATSSTPEACTCLCDMHVLTDSAGNPVTWTIQVNDNDWPHTDDSTKTVTVHSPFSGVAFGTWAAGPPAHRITEPNWLVLGHELCGHASLLAKGTHPAGPAPRHGGRPSHDPTVTIENRIAAEHGVAAADLRGLFADPHHGESTARVTISEFPTGASNISTLPAAEQAKIDIAETFIKSAPVKMDVIGHSDQQGGRGAKASVSRARAMKVRAELVSRRIDPARFLATRGVSDTECSAPGDQPACRKADVFMFVMEGGSVTHP